MNYRSNTEIYIYLSILINFKNEFGLSSEQNIYFYIVLNVKYTSNVKHNYIIYILLLGLGDLFDMSFFLFYSFDILI